MSRNNRRKSHIATLRKEVINKFKSSARKPNTSQNLQDILKKAQFNKKSIFDDSGDDGEGGTKVPNFDCTAGLCLSDSESEGEDDKVSNEQPKSKKIAVVKTQSNDKEVDEQAGDDDKLKRVHDNLQKMNEIAEKLAGASKKKVSKDSQKENVNVADILALGESGASKPKAKMKKKRQAQSDESESDDNWEDVEGNKPKKINSHSYVEQLKRFEYIEQ